MQYLAGAVAAPVVSMFDASATAMAVGMTIAAVAALAVYGSALRRTTAPILTAQVIAA